MYSYNQKVGKDPVCQFLSALSVRQSLFLIVPSSSAHVLMCRSTVVPGVHFLVDPSSVLTIFFDRKNFPFFGLQFLIKRFVLIARQSAAYGSPAKLFCLSTSNFYNNKLFDAFLIYYLLLLYIFVIFYFLVIFLIIFVPVCLLIEEQANRHQYLHSCTQPASECSEFLAGGSEEIGRYHRFFHVS